MLLSSITHVEKKVDETSILKLEDRIEIWAMDVAWSEQPGRLS